ncbi:NADPH-dependent FMN reductase [Mucilaginibacter calamicampi]|uniref:NADPH-dependent FMN reductase n=1 Tax=Mucilaginibacter calamicampi TaxID=1302352 RepID=A0ABW2YUT6_9SPHI
MPKNKILAIVGSASANSSNHRLVRYIEQATRSHFEVTVIADPKVYPHFDPDTTDAPPPAIVALRNEIAASDGIIICTPEYVFSIPSGLKNLIEWCVSTTIFSDKPVGLITASASGEKGHQELQLIMNTLMAKLTPATSLLIQGIKGKIDQEGNITDPLTRADIEHFIDACKTLVCAAS